MTDHWRVLVTGPVQGLDRWRDAAAEVGWEPVPFPMVTIEPTDTDPLPPDAALPDWVAITSSNALSALAAACATRPELRDVPHVCVGRATAERAVELGLPEPRVPQPGAQDAGGLAKALLVDAHAGQRVLWPRGDRARDLGSRLEAAGLLVDSPVVYRTIPRELDEEPPPADAVFFASPTAVQAWRAEERDTVPAAIAIGWTTYEALEPVSHCFSMVLPLATPSIESFQDCLRSFYPST